MVPFFDLFREVQGLKKMTLRYVAFHRLGHGVGSPVQSAARNWPASQMIKSSDCPSSVQIPRDRYIQTLKLREYLVGGGSFKLETDC